MTNLSCATTRAFMAELANLRQQDRRYRDSERQRINALYCDALLDPQPIYKTEAEREYDETVRLMNTGYQDHDSLKRRLLTLRLRCRKSVTLKPGDELLEALVDNINAALDRRQDDIGSDTADESIPRANDRQLAIGL